MGVLTIIVALLPLLLKLIEFLQNKQASGQPLTNRERKVLNKALRACAQLRTTASAMGLNPDGDEPAMGTIPEEEMKELLPLTLEQFTELKRLLELGDKATPEDWKKLEDMIG